MHQLPAGQRAKEQTLTRSSASRLRALHPWLISGFTLGADQLTKHLLVKSLAPGQSLPIFPPLLHLTYVQNTGAAFGLFKGQQAVFIGLSVVIIVWIAWELFSRPAMAPRSLWACGLILGGAAGNLIDRVRCGYVIDFLDLRVWPVFNIGDSAITIGATLLIWHAMCSNKQQATSDREEHR